jgi:hypothetical protein
MMEVGLSTQLVVLLLLAILHNHGSFIVLECYGATHVWCLLDEISC